MIANVSENSNDLLSQYTQPVCDFKYLKEIVNGKTNLIISIMDVFLKQVPEELLNIKEAIINIDYKTIRIYAHTMKSSVSIMGISALKPVLKEMENLGIAEDNIEKIKRLNNKLNEICKKAFEEIKIEKHKYKNNKIWPKL